MAAAFELQELEDSSAWVRFVSRIPLIGDADREVLLNLNEGTLLAVILVLVGASFAFIYGLICYSNFYCFLWNESIFMMVIAAVLLSPACICCCCTAGRLIWHWREEQMLTNLLKQRMAEECEPVQQNFSTRCLKPHVKLRSENESIDQAPNMEDDASLVHMRMPAPRAQIRSHPAPENDYREADYVATPRGPRADYDIEDALI